MSQGGMANELRTTDDVYQFFIGPGECDSDMLAELASQQHEADEADPDADWVYIVSCPGGDTAAGSAIYEQILTYSKQGGGTHFSTTIARGQCASMATLIMQAGDWRVTGLLTWWMFHEPTSGAFEATVNNIKADLQMLEDWDDVANVKMLERTKISLGTYKAIVAKGVWYASPDNLLNYGFVDEVR